MKPHWKDTLRTGAPRPRAALRASLRADDATRRRRDLDELMTDYGLATDPTVWGDLRSPLKRWQLLLGSDIAALHRPAAQAIETILDRLDAGASVQDLDLVFDGGTPQFREQLGGAIRRGGPLPMSRFASATAHERRYGEALLAVQLNKPSAYRCPGALAQLDARWTVPAMREVLSGDKTDPYMVRELRAAVTTLTSQ